MSNTDLVGSAVLSGRGHERLGPPAVTGNRAGVNEATGQEASQAGEALQPEPQAFISPPAFPMRPDG